MDGSSSTTRTQPACAIVFPLSGRHWAEYTRLAALQTDTRNNVADIGPIPVLPTLRIHGEAQCPPGITPHQPRRHDHAEHRTAARGTTTSAAQAETARYARCIKASKRVRWDIDADVIRGRDFDFTQTFLPDGPLEGRRARLPDRRRSAACCRRCRAARTPTSSGWSSASSAPRCSRSPASTGSATRSRSRRWCASATRS